MAPATDDTFDLHRAAVLAVGPASVGTQAQDTAFDALVQRLRTMPHAFCGLLQATQEGRLAQALTDLMAAEEEGRPQP